MKRTFRSFVVAMAVFDLVVGLIGVISGAVLGDAWRGMRGVAVMAIGMTLLLMSHDPIPAHGIRARATTSPSTSDFALGARSHDRRGVFRPLLVRVRTAKRGDWWMALECTPAQLRELADLLRPYAIGETDEQVGQTNTEPGVPACTLDGLLDRIRVGRLVEERVDVRVGGRHEADPPTRREHHGDDPRDGGDHGGQGLDPVPPVPRQDPTDPFPIHATNPTHREAL